MPELLFFTSTLEHLSSFLFFFFRKFLYELCRGFFWGTDFGLVSLLFQHIYMNTRCLSVVNFFAGALETFRVYGKKRGKWEKGGHLMM